MKPSLQSVFDKLSAKGRKGLTWDDFAKGKDLRKRISELRDLRYNIQTQWEVLPGGCRRVRYFLLGTITK